MKLSREEAAKAVETFRYLKVGHIYDEGTLDEALRMGAEALRFISRFSERLKKEFDDADARWRGSYPNDEWRECRRDTLEDILGYLKETSPGGTDEA